MKTTYDLKQANSNKTGKCILENVSIPTTAIQKVVIRKVYIFYAGNLADFGSVVLASPTGIQKVQHDSSLRLLLFFFTGLEKVRKP